MTASSVNKRVALVRVETDATIHPLGLLYLGDALKKAGYEVKVFNIFSTETDKALEEIAAMKPLFVGLSVLTGLQTKYSYEVSKAIRGKDRTIRIVWGGVHPTMLPEDCLKEDCVDIVCMGEGEEVIVELANRLSLGQDLKDVESVAYKPKGAIVVNPRRSFIRELDKYEPDWSLLDDFERCVTVLPDGRRQADFIASKGCPYNCAFCYNLKFNERRWRKYSAEYVVKKIGYLRKEHDIRAVQFHDDNFFVDMDRAFGILEKLKEIDVVATSCLIRIEALDEEVLKRLRALGVKRIFVGWESGSERILKLINKQLTPQMILDKVSILSKFPDITITAASILGFPTETWDEICRTIDLGVKLAEAVPNAVVTYQTFLPFPGSYLYQLAAENGFSLPKEMSGYANYNTFGDTMELTWLPWADKNTKKIFYRVDKYGKLLTHSRGSNALRTLGKEIFYRISRFRLKKKYFMFPWEIAVLYYFNRYYNPKCPI